MSPQTIETAELLVSELVTNAVLHGGMDPEEHIGLKVASSSGRLRAEVRDGGPECDPGALPEPGQDRGWGLYLVQSLSDRWGIEREEVAVVWFELDRPG